MKYFALLTGGIGPDVWDKEIEVDAVDIADGLQQASARATEMGGEVACIDINRAVDPTVADLQDRIKTLIDGRKHCLAVLRAAGIETDGCWEGVEKLVAREQQAIAAYRTLDQSFTLYRAGVASAIRDLATSAEPFDRACTTLRSLVAFPTPTQSAFAAIAAALSSPVPDDILRAVAIVSCPAQQPKLEDLQEQLELLRRSHTLYIPAYCSDSPGYHGPVVVVVWPASPGALSSYIQREGQWVLCNQSAW